MERKYNFETILNSITKIKLDVEYGVLSEHLKEIKDELNIIFNDSVCKEVLYTNNTDNMFFGLKVLPIIDADDIYDYILDDEPQRIGKYIVEIDSKLLNPIINLTPAQILSVLLYEIGNLVGDSSPVDNARNAINIYLAANKDYIRISSSIHYKEILAYGLKDYLSKCRSMFYTADKSDIYADEFISMNGFADDLSTAYDKIRSDNMKMYENCEISKLITLTWALGLYNNIPTRRVGCIHVLTRAKVLTGSRLERIELDNVIKRIKHIDDNVLTESSSIDAIRLKIKEKMRKSRLNSLRTIDSAFYELNMQVRNVEDEDDALYLMRQVNNNISIISDYIENKDCDEYEREKWDQTLNKFIQLREKLSKSLVYKNKNYGLFVNYPDIVENRY